jgi:hypothetical protein
MRRRLSPHAITAVSALATLALAIVGAAAGAGAAGSATTPAAQKLAIGDAIDVKGTRIACYAIVSNRKPGIGCVLIGGSSPIAGSYGVGMATDGTAVMTRINANGTATQIVKRTPQAAGASGAAGAARAARSHVYAGVPGAAFGLPIDATHVLGCRIIDVRPGQAAPLFQGIKISCWRATSTLPVANSDGVEISDRFAAVFRFDGKGNVTATIAMKQQPAIAAA